MKPHLSQIILASAIVLAAIILACANRYAHMGGPIILDKWTGIRASRRNTINGSS